MMSPGALLNFLRRPWKFQGSWVQVPKIIVFVIFLLLCCDTSYSQQVIEDNNEQDWLLCGHPHKCMDQPIQENRTLVKLGYLTNTGADG